MFDKFDKIEEYSPNFRRITENQKFVVRDNAILLRNTGNTRVKIDADFYLDPDEFLETPFTKPFNVCVWDFAIIFEGVNVVDDKAVKKELTIITTNFHSRKLANYKSV